LLQLSENKDSLGSLITSGLTESIGVAVIVTDDGGVIRSWNRAAEQLYGWRRTRHWTRKSMFCFPRGLTARVLA
jgi:PAS domain S-box-containing protein